MNDTGGQELGRRLAAGDDAALAECVTGLGSLVRRYARRHVPADDVDDLVQTVFIEVWRHRRRYDPERSLEAWILGIAHNRAIDHLRARWRHDRRSVPLDDTTEGAAQSGGYGGYGGYSRYGRYGQGDDPQHDQEQEYVHDLRHALAALPQAQRTAIELAYFADLSQREIAERTDTPIGTIKARTARGLHRLGALLAAA